jgi:hypothetical protein
MGGGDAEPPAASSAPQHATLADPGVLAVVNSKPVLTETFRNRVKVLPKDHPNGFSTEVGTGRIVLRQPKTIEERRILLDELLKEEVLVQDALNLGLDRDLAVKQQIDDARRLVLLKALIGRLIEEITVTPEEIKQQYQAYPAAYQVPERIRLRHLATPDLTQAEALRQQVVTGGDMELLGQGLVAEGGGPTALGTGWYIRALAKQLQALAGEQTEDGMMPPQLEAVAFALEPGQVSQPVKGLDSRYYVFRLEERMPATQKPIAEVWDQISTALKLQKQQKTLQEHVDNMWKQAVIDRNDARLENL